MQKPVYLLVKGDVFIGDDGRGWIVDEVIKPDDWHSNLHIGAKPKNWEIFAHTSGQGNRRFYYQGTKLVTMKDKA